MPVSYTHLDVYKRQTVIDQSRVADGFLFATHRDRCLYLGKSVDDRPRWLRDNVGKWQRIEDVQQEAPPLRPCESKINVGPMPAEPADSSSSPDVRNDGDDEADVALVDNLAGDSSSPYQPTLLPTPVSAIIKKVTTEAKPPLRANPAMSETMGPKDEIGPFGATRGKQGRSGGRQLKKQKLPPKISKVGRRLSPERMRIVLDSLTEYPILSHAARKAGIHRKTLEYWIKRSEAGDDGYDIEWQGLKWRFHEQCKSAIDEARG